MKSTLRIATIAPLEQGEGIIVEGFTHQNHQLYIDGVAAEAIASALGTPTYVYSASTIRRSYQRLHAAFAPLEARLHYALKACGNLHICRLLRSLGAGMDVVSGGELERAWLADTPMADIVFAGVGKTAAELRAALDGRFSPIHPEEAHRFGRHGLVERGPVGLFNVESVSELERLDGLAAELGVRAKACIRVNPDVDARTHEYTTTGKEENKFGIDVEKVLPLFAAYATSGVDLVGLHVHIGSPVREIEPYVASVHVLLELVERLEQAGFPVRVLNLGGGWAVDYQDGEAPQVEDYAARLIPLLQDRVTRGGLKVLLEPGRSILANAGVLLTRVQHVKQGRRKVFVICDGGMHTLIRPAFYQAFHFIWPTRAASLPPRREDLRGPGLIECDVVGPICETGDFLARSRFLPSVAQGDLLAVYSAGAYGMSMTSNYNDHGRPAEVLVDGDRALVINERQPLISLLETECLPRSLPGATLVG